MKLINMDSNLLSCPVTEASEIIKYTDINLIGTEGRRVRLYAKTGLTHEKYRVPHS